VVICLGFRWRNCRVGHIERGLVQRLHIDYAGLCSVFPFVTENWQKKPQHFWPLFKNSKNLPHFSWSVTIWLCGPLRQLPMNNRMLLLVRRLRTAEVAIECLFHHWLKTRQKIKWMIDYFPDYLMFLLNQEQHHIFSAKIRMVSTEWSTKMRTGIKTLAHHAYIFVFLSISLRKMCVLFIVLFS
jgi:hypothetical protein